MTEWSKNWPDKEGFWWFYGWKFGNTEKPPKYSFVECVKTGNGLLLIGDGRFWYKREGGIGRWKPANLPEPPRELD